MHRLTLDQFRTTFETGGILSVVLVAQGGVFHIEAETSKGHAVLIKARTPELRQFRDATKALSLLREIGIREARVDARQWQPEQANLGRAEQMKAAHEAAELKRLLEERIREADDPATVWYGHDQVFDELEADIAE